MYFAKSIYLTLICQNVKSAINHKLDHWKCIRISKKKSSYGILLPKLFWPNVRKKLSCDRGKLLKIEAESYDNIGLAITEAFQTSHFLGVWGKNR